MHYRHPWGDVEIANSQLDVWVWRSRERSGPGALIWKYLACRWCLMPWMRAFREESEAQVRISRKGRASIRHRRDHWDRKEKRRNCRGVFEIGKESVSRREWSTANAVERVIKIINKNGNALHLHRTFWFFEFSNTLLHTSSGIINPFSKQALLNIYYMPGTAIQKAYGLM